MSCIYTLSGHTIDCKNSAGGVRELYIVDTVDVSTKTVDASSGIITGITMKSGKLFHTYQLKNEVGQFTSIPTLVPASGTNFYTNSVTFDIPKMEASKRLEFLALTTGLLKVIVRDNNDKYWGVGFTNYAEVVASAATTGKAMGDANQYSYDITEMAKMPAYPIDASIMSAICDSNFTSL